MHFFSSFFLAGNLMTNLTYSGSLFDKRNSSYFLSDVRRFLGSTDLRYTDNENGSFKTDPPPKLFLFGSDNSSAAARMLYCVTFVSNAAQECRGFCHTVKTRRA